MQRSKSAILAGIALAATIMSAAPAQAITVIDSSAYGISANLTLLGLIGVGVGPIAAVSGSATPAYLDDDTVLSVNQTLTIGTPVLAAVSQGVKTGLINTSASSPYPGTPTGAASASVDGLSLALTTKTLLGSPINILTLGANVVSSDTSVSAANTLSSLGSSQLAGLTLSGLALGALSINGSAFVNPLPNTVLLNVLGLKIILNEQLITGDGTTGLGRTTNAIHIIFDKFIIGGGLLSGGVTVAQSQAVVLGPPIIIDGPLPEPATWLQMITGFGLVGLAARRRKTVAA